MGLFNGTKRLLNKGLDATLGDDKEVRNEALGETAKKTWMYGGPGANLVRALFYKNARKNIERDNRAQEMYDAQAEQSALGAGLAGALAEGQMQASQMQSQMNTPMDSYDQILMDATPGGASQFDSWKGGRYG